MAKHLITLLRDDAKLLVENELRRRVLAAHKLVLDYENYCRENDEPIVPEARAAVFTSLLAGWSFTIEEARNISNTKAAMARQENRRP